MKSVHTSLKRSHDQLQVKLSKEIATCSPFVLIGNANATNPCCEHVHLVEENAKLKEQLEKGLVTCKQGEKNLNNLLSNQKEVVAKEGLGFAPKPKKKNTKKKDKTKQALPLKLSLSKRERTLLRRRRIRWFVVVPREAKPLHPMMPTILTNLMFYVMLVMGTFMPNSLVLLKSIFSGLFGFPRPLLLTSKDPFKNGYLKPSIDLM